MPMYLLTTTDGCTELLQADTARQEGIHTVLRGTAYVMGRPREVVLRRVPTNVVLECSNVCDA